MKRQRSLFSRQPLSTDDVDGATALAATFDLFADHLRADGKTEHTVKAFLSDLRLLAAYAVEELAIGQLRNALLVDFLEWMEHERGLPCSRKTYARRVTTLKVYCKWLCELRLLAEDPAESIRQRSGPAPLSHVLTDAQAGDCIIAARSIMRGAAQDFRPEFLFRLLLQTGIKKAEWDVSICRISIAVIQKQPSFSFATRRAISTRSGALTSMPIPCVCLTLTCANISRTSCSSPARPAIWNTS
ncbi:MAG: site-specific integrase [Chloroflexi bacterium]|nr:site-specific integrase [Chloroflexota bacterium]